MVLASTGSDANPFRYGGQAGYYTDASNLTQTVLCGLRWYSPALGRWLSRDPIGYEGGANLYEYCDSNPVGPLDPMGLEPPHPEEEAENYNLNDCTDLLRYINALMQRLGQRYLDMRQDPNNLYQLARRELGHPIFGSSSGHRQRYRDLQRNLRDAWKQFQGQCGKHLTKEAQQQMNREVRDAEQLRAPAYPDPGYRGTDQGLRDRTYLLVPLFMVPAQKMLMRPIMRQIISHPQEVQKAIQKGAQEVFKKAA